MATKPLFGDPAANAPVWSKTAVLLGSVTATTPAHPAPFTLNDPGASTPVVTEWDPVGALDDANPADEGQETITVNSHSAFGHGVYAKTFRDQEEKRTFTCLETTLVTLGILFDASGLTEAGGVISGKLKMRDPNKKYRLALHRENDTTVERHVTENYAILDVAPTRNFADGKATRQVTMTVIKNAEGEVYDYWKGPKA